MNFFRRESDSSFKRTNLPRIARCLVLASVCAAIASSSGCRPISRAVTGLQNKGYPEKVFEGYRDHVWAQRAYNLRFGNTNMSCEGDFESGFIEGYCSMCEGGNGVTPALPPDKYWGQRYQSVNGKKSVKAWFRGYPEGVRAAQQDGAGRNRKIYVSEEMKAALAMQKKSDATITAADFEQTRISMMRENVRQDPGIPRTAMLPQNNQVGISNGPLPMNGQQRSNVKPASTPMPLPANAETPAVSKVKSTESTPEKIESTKTVVEPEISTPPLERVTTESPTPAVLPGNMTFPKVMPNPVVEQNSEEMSQPLEQPPVQPEHFDPTEMLPIPIVRPGDSKDKEVGDQAKTSRIPTVVVDEFPLPDQIKKTSWEKR